MGQGRGEQGREAGEGSRVEEESEAAKGRAGRDSLLQAECRDASLLKM